jgi:hypothetical protein
MFEHISSVSGTLLCDSQFLPRSSVYFIDSCGYNYRKKDLENKMFVYGTLFSPFVLKIRKTIWIQNMRHPLLDTSNRQYISRLFR